MTDKIREALVRLVEAVQFTPLGIRGIKAVEAAHVALAQQPSPVAQEPVAWGAFQCSGKRAGKLYAHADTEAMIEAYILNVHRSNDSLTLRKGPLYASPLAAQQPDTVAVPREDLERVLSGEECAACWPEVGNE